MMEYKGYVATVEFDVDAKLFHGQVVNIRDVVTFQGTSVDELQLEFANSVEDYLEFCTLRGQEPDRPFSGKLMLRMSPELHRSVTICAAAQKISVNKWIVAQLQEAASAVRMDLVADRESKPKYAYSAALPYTENQQPILLNTLGHTDPGFWRHRDVATSSIARSADYLRLHGENFDFASEENLNVS